MGFTEIRRVRTYRRTGGIDFASHALYVCTQHFTRCSLFMGTTRGQNLPVFGHWKSMVMETAKFLIAGRNHFTKSCFSEPCTLFTEQWVFSLFQTKPHETEKRDMVIYGQDITEEILNEFQRLQIFRCSVYLLRFGVQRLHRTTNRIMEDFSIWMYATK